MEKKALLVLRNKNFCIASDCMGSIEISLQGLLDAAKSGSALQVQPPPMADGPNQDAGKLYVEVASVGFPQVTLNSVE